MKLWTKFIAALAAGSVLAGVAIAAIPPNVQHLQALAVTNGLWTWGNQVAGHNVGFSSTAAPTGTASLTFVMVGLAQAFTPTATGTAFIEVTGDMTSSVATDGGNLQCVYGTGTAPTNGATLPASGVTVGSVKKFTSGSTTPGKVHFICDGETGTLIPGTAYWVDVQFEAVTGGTFTLADVDAYVTEN